MKPARWLPVAAFLIGPFFEALAAQQGDLSLDVGTAAMQFADSIGARSVSLSPWLRLLGHRARLNATGTLSQLEGSWTNSGLVDAAVVPFAEGRLSGELGVLAGGSSHANGSRTGQLLASGKLHVASAGSGVWAGAGVGRTWDGNWRDVVQADAGAWFAMPSATMTAAITPTIIEDTIRYFDSFLSFHSAQRAWDLDGSLGFRVGQQLPSLPANRSVWGQVAAVFWATPRLGVVASAGTYPVDFTQGYPGGQYISVAVRLRSASRFALPSVIATPTRLLRELRWTRVRGDTHRVRVHAGGVRSVELMADFTGWQPVALRHEGGGWWGALLEVPRGAHEVNIRVNGGSWLVPPGTIPRTDEFGGGVGVMMVR
jgi:hypothetical protein